MQDTTVDEKLIPKGYKKSVLGVIPEDWEVNLLGELGQFSKGKGITKDQLSNDGYPCVRYGEIYTTHDFYIKKFKSYIEGHIAEESKEIKKGDLLFAASGETVEEIGKAVAYLNDEKAYAGGDIIILSVKNKISSLLLSFFLETDYGKKQKRVLGQGNSVVHIYASDLAKVKILVPNISEQQPISDCLTTWDRAIEKLNQLIVQKELCKKGLMQELLSGKKRLRGFDGEWLENYMGEITENFSRRNKTTIDARVFSVTNKNGFVLQSDHFEREIAGDDLSNYKIIKKDEFAYNPARINVGSIAFFKEEIGIISSLYVCFKTNGLVRNNYLLQLLNVDYMKHKFNAYGEGGVRVYLWYELFSKIKLLVPPIDEQDEILGVLEKADDEIQLLKNKLELLKMQKKGLMQVLLTGKKRLIK